MKKLDPHIALAALSQTVDSVIVVDGGGRVLHANTAFGKVFGHETDAVIGADLADLLAGEGTDREMAARLGEHRGRGEGFHEEILLYGKTGKPIWVSVAVDPVPDDTGEVTHIVIRLRDITNTKQIELLQRDILTVMTTGIPLKDVADLLCRRVEAIAPEIVSSLLLIDDGRKLRPLSGPSLPDQYNEALNGMPIGPNIGSCGSAAFLGKPVCVMDIETDERWIISTVEPAQASRGREMALAIGLRACWSSPIIMRDGRVVGTFAFYYRTRRGPSAFHEEIVAACLHLCMLAIEREEQALEIEQLSSTDPLTGLGNLAWLLAESDRLLSQNRGQTAFLFLDIDRFKSINNAFGAHSGDLMLIDIAHRIKAFMPREGVVGRAYGDSFVVIIPDCGECDASILTERLLRAIQQPFLLSDTSVSISASMGISVAAGSGADPAALIARAKEAAQNAKSAGGNRYLFHNQSLVNQSAREWLVLESALRKAIAQGAVTLAYQPQIRLPDMDLYGVEALARWAHPELGDVPPARFITLAEDTGLIALLGEHLLRQACREMAMWRRAGIDVPRVSVNLSPLHFSDPNLPAFIMALLDEFDLPASALVIEIIESVMLNERDGSHDVVKALQMAGIGMSLDDFGIGYSNLSNLERLPVTEIKIDRSFVMKLEESVSARAIVAAVSDIGHSLGMMVVGEGVESERQSELLAESGCDIMQGYWFGKPMCAEEFRRWFQLRQPSPLLSMLAGTVGQTGSRPLGNLVSDT